MTIFKVGDTLRVLDDSDVAYRGLLFGHLVEVTKVTSYRHGDYVNVIDKNGDAYSLLSSDRFELVKSKEAKEETMKLLTYRFVGNSKIMITVDYSDYHEIDDSNTAFSEVQEILKDLSTGKYDDEVHHTEAGVQVSEEFYERLLGLISPRARISRFISDNESLEITDYSIEWDGVQLHGVLVDRILQLIDGGFDAKPLVNFLAKLQENPSYRVREQLFGFLEYGKNAITPDGDFLAYKYVRDDFMSAYDGTTDHSVGKIIEMPRHMVNDDPNQTCSAGLHCCSKEYLGVGYSRNTTVLCMKVNPRDVVAVPTDYNNTKMRVCRYESVAQLTKSQIEDDYLSSKPVIDIQDTSGNSRPESSFIDDIDLCSSDYMVTVCFKNGTSSTYDDLSDETIENINEALSSNQSYSRIYNNYIRGLPEAYVSDDDWDTSWVSSQDNC